MVDAARTSAIGLQTTLVRASRVIERRTRASVVLLADEPPIVLRGTGVAIWDAFAVARSVDDAVAALADAHGATRTTVALEVMPVVAALHDAGVLVRVDDTALAATERRSFRGLDLVFTFTAADDDLRAACFELFDPLATNEPAVMHLDVTATSAAPFTVRVDGVAVCEAHFAAHALAHVCWEVNRRAIDAARSVLVVHASAVARDGLAVVFPGGSGAGKSTLAAACVAAGFGYLTDDATALDPHHGRVRPYPKPIALRHDVLGGFPMLARSAEHSVRHAGDECYVTAAMLGGSNAGAATPRLVVFPTYTRSGTNVPEPISRAEALLLLAEHSFNFVDFGGDALDLLAESLRACQCYRVEFSDASAVVEFVTTSLATATGLPIA